MLVCPLDCWDTCVMDKKGDKFLPTNQGITNKYLCYKLNNYFKYPKHNPKYNLDDVEKLLKSTTPNRILFLRGSGNLGIMQNVTKLFFDRLNATFAKGSSCDGKGEEGIIRAIGDTPILPINTIKEAKNIIIWGRNPYITNTHLIPYLKHKNIITIDARYTLTAKNSSTFYQIKPNTDIFLAKYLITKNPKYLEITGLDNVDKLIDILDRSIILLGLGVAKNSYGDKTTHTIYALNRPTAFLGNSMSGLTNPFKTHPKNIMPLFEIEWDKIDVVFIQGANPLVSLPNFTIPNDKKVIVFGKYLDKTAKRADIFIPTKDFYAKNDIRSSYFHEFVFKNEKICDDYGISEYDFTKEMFDRFGFDGLLDEDEYISQIYKPKREVNYPTKKVEFIDFEVDYKDTTYLITAKNKTSLNSQFKTDKFAYMNDYEGRAILKTTIGELEVQVKKDTTIPKNAVFMYAGSDVNKIISSNGYNATYSQEVNITLY
ncbi:MAG: molybdopterin oxidoreductase [Epsilonproteobacteria bacterium]|nr:molybdopterin oxidoreductase [Campylobacterota bacterium]